MGNSRLQKLIFSVLHFELFCFVSARVRGRLCTATSTRLGRGTLQPPPTQLVRTLVQNGTDDVETERNWIAVRIVAAARACLLCAPAKPHLFVFLELDLSEECVRSDPYDRRPTKEGAG